MMNNAMLCHVIVTLACFPDDNTYFFPLYYKTVDQQLQGKQRQLLRSSPPFLAVLLPTRDFALREVFDS